jgi:RHS repeat-associated protein
MKSYELGNFRGDVQQVISDNRIALGTSGQTATAYEADVYQVEDQYPFGWSIESRSLVVGESHRFGFNGKENDRDADAYDFGARMYNSKIGRWWSVDPLANAFANESPYIFAGNNPVFYIDHGGLFKWPGDEKQQAEYEKQYPKLTAYLKDGGLTKLLQNEDIRAGLRITGKFSNEQIDNLIGTYGTGIEIIPYQLCEGDNCDIGEINGYLDYRNEPMKDPNIEYFIKLDIDLLQELENSVKIEDAEARLFGVVKTLLHEATHYGDRLLKIPKGMHNTSDGDWKRVFNPKTAEYHFYHNDFEVGKSTETGQAFETGIWHEDQPHQLILSRKQGEQGLKDSKETISTLKQNGKTEVIPQIIKK